MGMESEGAKGNDGALQDAYDVLIGSIEALSARVKEVKSKKRADDETLVDHMDKYFKGVHEAEAKQKKYLNKKISKLQFARTGLVSNCNIQEEYEVCFGQETTLYNYQITKLGKDFFDQKDVKAIKDIVANFREESDKKSV